MEEIVNLQEKEAVNAEFEKALAAAKEFHPVTQMYIDGYTGEVSRYKTPDNYVPDAGVFNDKPDLCHTEDHVSIAQMYARLKAMRALSIQDSDFDIDESEASYDDLDDTTLSDVVSESEDYGDFENIVKPFAAEKYGSVSEQEASDSAAIKSDATSKKDDEAPGVAEEE